MGRQEIGSFLKEHCISPSYQRVAIYEYLVKERNHPNIQTIFDALKGEIQTLSKTTIYNTMDLFLKSGIVQRLVIEDNETRYDAMTKSHGHFKCTSCGEIIDFDLPEEIVNLNSLSQYQISEEHIYLKGTCPKCQKS